MASKLNLSPTTIGECIKHLESAGLVKVQRAKGKPTVICVLHDLKDNEDRFGLEDEEDEEFDDSELEWLPDYAKDAIRAWREEDTEDEDSEQREWEDDVEDRVSSRGSTLPDDEDSFFDIENIPLTLPDGRALLLCYRAENFDENIVDHLKYPFLPNGEVGHCCG